MCEIKWPRNYVSLWCISSRSHTYLCSTQRNQTESPLLRLPPELRNVIYTYVLSPRYLWIDIIGKDMWLIGNADEKGYVRVSDSLRFMETCHQIRSEAEVLYWQSKVVRSGPSYDAESSIGRLLDALTLEQCNAIRTVQVHKDELSQDTLWEQLLRLQGLKQLTLWGSYYSEGSDSVLVEGLTKISKRVDALVGHKVELLVEEDD